MLRDSIFPILDFSGGLVTKGSILGLESKQTPNCLNVHSSAFGPLQKRKGYAKVNSATATGVANGLYNFTKNSTTQFLMGYFGSALKKMDVVSSAWDGTWDAITFGTAMSSDLMHFANLATAGADGVLLMTTESQDTPQAWTGSGNTVDITDAPDGKYVTVWNNMVVMANIKTGTYPDRVQRSAIASYTDWSGTGSGTDDIITSGDIGITGFGQLAGRLYPFKKWSIHRFTYLGGSPLIDVKQVKSSSGTNSPRTIVNAEVPGEGERLFFLSTDRQICQFDGYQAIPISEPIQSDNEYSSVYMNNINQSHLDKCWAMVIPHRHWVVFFVPIGAATTPNYAIVYDYYAKSFWPFNTMPFLSGCISDNGAGIRLPYTQGTGFAYLYDSGNTDDTAAIAASWESNKFDAGAIPQLKKARQAVVTLKAVGAYDLTFGYRTNWTSAYTSAPVISQATNQHVRDIPKLFNLLQMKLSDSTSTAGFEIYSLDRVGESKGVG